MTRGAQASAGAAGEATGLSDHRDQFLTEVVGILGLGADPRGVERIRSRGQNARPLVSGVVHDHVVETRVAGRYGLDDLDEGFDLDLDSGFLPDFPHRGLLERLTPLQGSTRNHPSTVLGLFAATNQKDIAPGIEDHRPDADEGATVHAGDFGTQGAATVGSGAGT